MPRATRLVGWAVLGQLALITATGVYLYFNYRPSSGGASAGLSSDARRSMRLSDLHALQSKVLVASSVAFLVLLTLKAIRSPRTLAAGISQLILILAASFTGFLLPWDQLGLWAVTVGTNMKGFRPIVEHAEQIRFAIIGGAEVRPGTVARWLALHVVITLAAAAVAVLGLTQLARRPPDHEEM